MISEKKYQKLVQELIHHDYLYYQKAEPIISDQDYDQLYKIIEEFEQAHPQKIDPASPTQRISDALRSGFVKKKHRTPMLSLANTYSKKELEEFIQRVQKLLSKKDILFSAELKIDGVAVCVVYKQGKLAYALTRGDGKIGDDITNNIKTIRCLPLVLKGDHVPDELEVRGEVFLPIRDFQQLNQEREENGDNLWANPRNAAAGSLKLLDPREVQARKLQLLFYGLGTVDNFVSQYEVHKQLRTMGLPVAQEKHFALCRTAQDILLFAEKIECIRSKLPFEIDGIVIKVDTLSYHDRLGVTGKCPRACVAYKFAAQQAITVVEDISVQLGRTGVITPVAHLRPTLLSGSTISRATLHNQEEIQRKDIRIFDTVVIEKGGDVIPKVVKVLKEKRTKNAIAWAMPKNCPFCSEALEYRKEEVAVRCANALCPQLQLQKLHFYVSKQGMDIAFLGVQVMKKLFDAGFVRNFADIYRLEKKEIETLANFQEKSINNLLASIEKSKKVPLHRFIFALGIKYVGKQTAQLLEEKAGSLELLYRMKEEQFLQIDGIGEKAAFSLFDFFSNKANQDQIQELLALGVTPVFRKKVFNKEHPFFEKSFVLTGSLEKYTREQATQIIKDRGGAVKSSVSKKIDYLLAGSEPGSKLEKAKNLHIRILSEREFSQYI